MVWPGIARFDIPATRSALMITSVEGRHDKETKKLIPSARRDGCTRARNPPPRPTVSESGHSAVQYSSLWADVKPNSLSNTHRSSFIGVACTHRQRRLSIQHHQLARVKVIHPEKVPKTRGKRQHIPTLSEEQVSFGSKRYLTYLDGGVGAARCQSLAAGAERHRLHHVGVSFQCSLALPGLVVPHLIPILKPVRLRPPKATHNTHSIQRRRVTLGKRAPQSKNRTKAALH